MIPMRSQISQTLQITTHSVLLLPQQEAPSLVAGRDHAALETQAALALAEKRSGGRAWAMQSRLKYLGFRDLGIWG